MGLREIAGIGALFTALARAITQPGVPATNPTQKTAPVKPSPPVSRPAPVAKVPEAKLASCDGKTIIIIVRTSKTPI